jgi:hypothetical protein
VSAPQKPDAAPARPERTDYRRLVERDWLGQWDLQRPDGSYARAIVQIEGVTRYVPRERRRVRAKDATGRHVSDAQGKPVFEEERLKRLAIRFTGKRKGWLAGPVSQQVLATLFGPIIQDWIGKRIELYYDPSVRFGKKVTGGLRISPRSPDATAQLTEDPLDNEVDEDAARRLDEAVDDFYDEEESASP